ncbi:MAG: hypothetical protein IPP83_13975 [Flavobacteriales bacterium]|nr:hypothetical protein [Flavobacteriales bacterium]
MSRQQQRIEPDVAFTPYIPAFTAGHISARAPISCAWRPGALEGQHGCRHPRALRHRSIGEGHGAPGRIILTLAFQPNERLEQDRTYTVEFDAGRLIEVPKGLQTFKFQVTTYKQGLDVKVTDIRSLSTTDLKWQRLVVSVYTSDDAQMEYGRMLHHETGRPRIGDGMGA